MMKDVVVVVPEVGGLLLGRKLGREGAPSAVVEESLAAKVREAPARVHQGPDVVVIVLDEVEVARPHVELGIVRERRVVGDGALVDGAHLVPHHAEPLPVQLHHLQLHPRHPEPRLRARLQQRCVERAAGGVDVAEDADLEARAVRGDEVRVVVFVVETFAVGVEGGGVVLLSSFEVGAGNGGGAAQGRRGASFGAARPVGDGGVDLAGVVDAAAEFEEVRERLQDVEPFRQELGAGASDDTESFIVIQVMVRPQSVGDPELGVESARHEAALEETLDGRILVFVVAGVVDFRRQVVSPVLQLSFVQRLRVKVPSPNPRFERAAQHAGANEVIFGALRFPQHLLQLSLLLQVRVPRQLLKLRPINIILGVLLRFVPSQVRGRFLRGHQLARLVGAAQQLEAVPQLVDSSGPVFRESSAVHSAHRLRRAPRRLELEERVPQRPRRLVEPRRLHRALVRLSESLRLVCV
mmetsp:Transcript_1482/g.4361  ORF Transcript_1482/g.4361 Transcript_1482/m.4361 type:complete len:467 (+) Transcript_1482:1118-2518(+)